MGGTGSNGGSLGASWQALSHISRMIVSHRRSMQKCSPWTARLCHEPPPAKNFS
jgi:hypothetical protein